jgi:hypothetical protein
MKNALVYNKYILLDRWGIETLSNDLTEKYVHLGEKQNQIMRLESIGFSCVPLDQNKLAES